MADDEDTESQLSEEEKFELRKLGYSIPDPKHNQHTFLAGVRDTKDSTKVGYLTEEELGLARHPVRAFKEFALISDKICDNSTMTEFFNSEAETVLATSLSRNGFLVNRAVMLKRVIEDETKIRKPSSSWFKRGNKQGEEQ